MLAYEFQTSINDGVINIPDEYREKLSKRVKVIIYPEDQENKAPRTSESYFTAISLDTIGFKFDRDEANE